MIVLDSSALLALLNEEKGGEIVEPLLTNSVMSAINVAEIVGILVGRYKLEPEDVLLKINQLISKIISFDEKQAAITAQLERTNYNQKLGLSLGDKACIALGISLNAPIYTADKAWRNLKAGVNINIIR